MGNDIWKIQISCNDPVDLSELCQKEKKARWMGSLSCHLNAYYALPFWMLFHNKWSLHTKIIMSFVSKQHYCHIMKHICAENVVCFFYFRRQNLLKKPINVEFLGFQD